MPKAVSLNKPVTTIGRAPDNDIVLPYDSEVSRYHAEIRREGAALVLYDRNSRNGTFVNNAQITRHTLREGDQVRVGNSVLYLQGGSLWVPDEAVIGAAAAGPTPALPIVLGIAGLLILLGALVWFVIPRREPPPLESVVAVLGGAPTSGSGTIVHSGGLILTANSVVGGAQAPWVGLISRPEMPPTTWYQTRVVLADANLNLAVLVITHDANGAPVRGPLNLRALPRADSDGLVEGERLQVIGYPVASPPVRPFNGVAQVQDAVVGRFEIWPDGPRQWVELDRDIGDFGYQGGAVLNESNELVGVPQPDPTAPRRVQPINLAEPIIRQALVTLGW